ncbi:MAG: PorT family protein [Alloprevotella sp.]|nr:PorT family protein [Paludibacteraceae bacterium]MBR1733527.1 PorT family protein [Alloprevotella sp.]
MQKVFRHILPVFLACVCVSAAAQQRKIQNKPFIDERRFHYGFFIGLHDQGLKLQNSGYTEEGTGRQWLAENDTQNFGFSVGILGEWRLTKTLGLRVSPAMHFGSKHIKFRDLSTLDTQTQDLKSCYIGVPVNLKVAAPRFNNYRPYIVAGLQPMYDLTAKKHGQLRTKPFALCLEAGLGCDLYLPFFKLIPELKFSLGLQNVLDRNRTDLTDASLLVFTQGVDKARTSMVSLTFYFE